LNSELSGVFQLGSGIETTLNELLQKIEMVVGKHSMPEVIYKPSRDGEVYKTYCDISKARKILGYNPSISLGEGLNESWDWFLNSVSDISEFKKAA